VFIFIIFQGSRVIVDNQLFNRKKL